jgi:hypothetical protein
MNKTIKKTLLISLITIMLISTSIAILPAHAAVEEILPAPNWNVTGTYTINVNYLGVDYPETLILTQIGSSITGVSLDTIPPTGIPTDSSIAGSSYFRVTGGYVTGDNVVIECTYSLSSLITTLSGSIASDGNMRGPWADNSPTGSRTGTWSTTTGAVYLSDLPPGVTVTGSPATYPGGVGGYEIELFSGTQKVSVRATITIHYNDPIVGNELDLRIWQYDYLVGDVNKDGKVNLLDIAIITKALGSTDGTLSPPPKYFTTKNWDLRCDLNSDHKVDLKDLCLALPNFGKTAQWIKLTTLSQDTDANTITASALIDSGFGVR